MVTKREKIYPPRSSTSLDDLHSVELERALARARMRFAVGGCVCARVCVLYRSATRTWPKAGISLISFPAALPAEVAIKIVWKGGRYAYNEYPGVLRFSWGRGEEELDRERGWRVTRWSSAVFWNRKEGGITRRGRWELTGANSGDSWIGEKEEEERGEDGGVVDVWNSWN